MSDAEILEEVAGRMRTLAVAMEGNDEAARIARKAEAIARTEAARLRESPAPTEITVTDGTRTAAIYPGDDRLLRRAAWAGIWLWRHPFARDHGGRRALVLAVALLGRLRRTLQFLSR